MTTSEHKREHKRYRFALTDKKIRGKEMKAPGRYPDGNGLFFQVTERGSRSWEYRFRIRGKLRSMGLGPYPATSLVEARGLRDDAHRLAKSGIDPITARRQKLHLVANALTVMQAAEGYIAVHESEWKTKRYAKQIRARLKKYVEPHIGHLSIADIQVDEIMLVLEPIWLDLKPTARRIRKHLEDIIDWAIAKKIRTDKSNPAEKKRLSKLLSFKKPKVKHFPALPFERGPAFLAELRPQKGVKARALEFTMLCATRIADICGGGKDHSVPMLWSHLDESGKLWNIPDVKTGKPHAVPLSDAAMLVIAEMKRYRSPNADPSTDFVFPGSVAGTVLNAATVRKLLKDMGYAGITTTHGKRACFRSWASETTNYEKDVIEACLAHAQGELDEAYMRGSYLTKRAGLMALWASYLEGNTVHLGATVIALRA